MVWWEEWSSWWEWHNWLLMCYCDLLFFFFPTAFFFLVGKLIFFCSSYFLSCQNIYFLWDKRLSKEQVLELTTLCRRAAFTKGADNKNMKGGNYWDSSMLFFLFLFLLSWRILVHILTILCETAARFHTRGDCISETSKYAAVLLPDTDLMCVSLGFSKGSIGPWWHSSSLTPA